MLPVSGLKKGDYFPSPVTDWCLKLEFEIFGLKVEPQPGNHILASDMCLGLEPASESYASDTTT